MDNLIQIWIRQAEESWLEMLHGHAKALFSGHFLPSHDHTHHYRVWNICRELLTEIGPCSPPMEPSLVEGILIASYFHDLGMVGSTREDHGYLGRVHCEQYFKESRVHPPARLPEILEAIELHDIKEQKIYKGIHPGVAPAILDLLSIADDLEALGNIGIYRYTEIYLKRNIRLGELGIRILGNASSRFRFFRESCEGFPGLIRRYALQFSDLVSFFDLYNQQLLTEPDPRAVFEGHLGVVNYIRTMTVEGETEPADFTGVVGKEQEGTIVTSYFTTLQHELEKARLF